MDAEVLIQQRTLANFRARATVAAALIQAKVVDIGDVDFNGDKAAMQTAAMRRLKHAVDAVMGGAVEG